MNFFYYLKSFGYNALPSPFFKWKLKQLKKYEQTVDRVLLEKRVNYYCKIDQSFPIPTKAKAIQNIKRTKGTAYYLDLKAFLNYFHPETAFAYVFGDSTEVFSEPTLIKARPINGENKNSVLFKLNKRRHFRWVNDGSKFQDKLDMLVWRGAAYQPLRKKFVRQFWNHSRFEVGQTNKPKEAVPWQKPYMSRDEQLRYKFIFCPEGNDVATNLKWAMSSNSLCLMPKPRYETWFMEGTLKPEVHYAEVKRDFSDIEDVMNYYSKNIEKAHKIIEKANEHVKLFQDKKFEDLLCYRVLEKYAKLSGQLK